MEHAGLSNPLQGKRGQKLVDGRVVKAPALGKAKAFVVYPDRRNMDLETGQDMATAYLEQKDLNHSFRCSKRCSCASSAKRRSSSLNKSDE
jgi:uncharacterized linocin/CFP29 family protein